MPPAQSNRRCLLAIVMRSNLVHFDTIPLQMMRDATRVQFRAVTRKRRYATRGEATTAIAYRCGNDQIKRRWEATTEIALGAASLALLDGGARNCRRLAPQTGCMHLSKGQQGGRGQQLFRIMPNLCNVAGQHEGGSAL